MKKYQLRARIVCDEIFEVEAENEHLVAERWLAGEGKYLYSLMSSSADVSNRCPMYVSEVQLAPDQK